MTSKYYNVFPGCPPNLQKTEYPFMSTVFIYAIYMIYQHSIYHIYLDIIYIYRKSHAHFLQAIDKDRILIL